MMSKRIKELRDKLLIRTVSQVMGVPEGELTGETVVGTHRDEIARRLQDGRKLLIFQKERFPEDGTLDLLFERVSVRSIV